MSEWLGVGAALLGSFLGGTASAGTRYAVGAIDPLAVVGVRYGIGALFLLPFAAHSLRKLRGSKDVYAVAALGVAFFAVYPYLFALAFAYTTAARGALVLSTMPLMTLAFALLFRQERFSYTRLLGIVIALGGLAFALSPKLEAAARDARRGDLIMIAAAFVQAICNVLSRPYIKRFGALPFTALALCAGAALLAAVSLATGVFAPLAALGAAAWIVLIYLGVVGCAFLWVLWSYGIQLASPSLVALTVTVNALTASFLGAVFLSEPVGREFAVGFIAVLVGIAVATNTLRRRSAPQWPSGG
jgi:drug/metabolite transporter (DMT)-like permease